MVTDEYVTVIENELGEVTKYSDIEGIYSSNFSNAYKKGTKFYSIKGISSEEAIAIQEPDGKYRKLVNNGKYGK